MAEPVTIQMRQAPGAEAVCSEYFYAAREMGMHISSSQHGSRLSASVFCGQSPSCSSTSQPHVQTGCLRSDCLGRSTSAIPSAPARQTRRAGPDIRSVPLTNLVHRGLSGNPSAQSRRRQLVSVASVEDVKMRADLSASDRGRICCSGTRACDADWLAASASAASVE